MPLPLLQVRSMNFFTHSSRTANEECLMSARGIVLRAGQPVPSSCRWQVRILRRPNYWGPGVPQGHLLLNDEVFFWVIFGLLFHQHPYFQGDLLWNSAAGYRYKMYRLLGCCPKEFKCSTCGSLCLLLLALQPELSWGVRLYSHWISVEILRFRV